MTLFRQQQNPIWQEYLFRLYERSNELPLQEYTYIDSSTLPFISRSPERVIGGLMDGETVYVNIVSIELELAQELLEESSFPPLVCTVRRLAVSRYWDPLQVRAPRLLGQQGPQAL